METGFAKPIWKRRAAAMFGRERPQTKKAGKDAGDLCNIRLRSRKFMKKKQIMLGLACFTALNVGNYAFASDNPFATVPQSTGYYEDRKSVV